MSVCCVFACGVVSHSAFQFIIQFHQAVVQQNVQEITVAYETGWNRLTEKFYAKQEWPEAEIIAPLVGDGVCYLSQCPLSHRFFRSCIPHPLPRTILPVWPRPIFICQCLIFSISHVYSRLQPDIDDRFHSWENSCELFNYLLSTSHSQSQPCEYADKSIRL